MRKELILLENKTNARAMCAEHRFFAARKTRACLRKHCSNATQSNDTGIDRLKSCENREQRALSTSIHSNDRDNLALSDRERNTVQRDLPTRPTLLNSIDRKKWRRALRTHRHRSGQTEDIRRAQGTCGS
jgi:hypothetical protein